MISKYLLEGRAWQLFMIFLVFTVLPGILWVSEISTQLNQFTFPLLSIIAGYWTFNLGVNLHRKIKNPNPLRFKLFTASLLGIFIFCFFFPYAIHILDLRLLFAINVLYFYCIYFVSMHLVSVESEKSAAFSEYGGTLILLLMLPYSIFWLQPRIRKIFLIN